MVCMNIPFSMEVLARTVDDSLTVVCFHTLLKLSSYSPLDCRQMNFR